MELENEPFQLESNLHIFQQESKISFGKNPSSFCGGIHSWSQWKTFPQITHCTMTTMGGC
jgi:hypothetical protein